MAEHVGTRLETTEFRTDDLPAADRFGAWVETAAQALVSTTIRSAHSADLRASLHQLDLGLVRVSSVSYPTLSALRTPKLIRRSDPEQYQVALAVSGSHGIVQAGREGGLVPGSLLIYDSSRPFDAVSRGTSEGNVTRLLLAQFPKSLLALPHRQVQRLLAGPVRTDSGPGALLAGHLRGLATGHSDFRSEDAPRLANVTLDLVSLLLAHELALPAGAAAESPETRRRQLRLQVQGFIQRNLADPELSPATVADRHRISLRHLHRLFEGEEEGRSVAAWIRQLRLERCRRDLSDPALATTPIHAIGRRWGFVRPGDFTRLFRRTYGMPPRDFRRIALGGTA
ncbi:helix-turn-helix domain-containing protein [Streptomyces sp. NPDC004111]|uniref:AraC-like ligand-binding domain-containing protein n=1 Tax=Streptomyces sp. NPDC004111 TaxID=3364690 RepID=UPI0036A1F3E4